MGEVSIFIAVWRGILNTKPTGRFTCDLFQSVLRECESNFIFGTKVPLRRLPDAKPKPAQETMTVSELKAKIDANKLRQEAEATFLKSYTPDGKCNDEMEEMECARFVQGYLAHAAKAEGLANELRAEVERLKRELAELQDGKETMSRFLHEKRMSAECERTAKLRAEVERLQRALADERSGDCDKDKTIRRLQANCDAALAALKKAEAAMNVVSYTDRSRGYPTGREWTELVNLLKGAQKEIQDYLWEQNEPPI